MNTIEIHEEYHAQLDLKLNIILAREVTAHYIAKINEKYIYSTAGENTVLSELCDMATVTRSELFTSAWTMKCISRTTSKLQS